MRRKLPDLTEKLAAAQHQIGTHWMNYLFAQCRATEDGRRIIPAELVERWQRQMRTPYAQLPEAEKVSDRHQALKILETAQIEPAPELIESLAQLQHEIWASWMRFLFACCQPLGADLIIPAAKVLLWSQQMREYAQLPETDKASDRDHAARILQITHPEGVTDDSNSA